MTQALVLPARTPPGPPGSLVLGNLRELARDPLGLFLRAAVEHGGLARIRVAHLHVYLASEPAFIKRILVDNMRNYEKGVSYESLRHVIGDGLLVADGELWRRQRRLMNPAFARQALFDKLPTMIDVVASVCERFETYAASGETVDLVAEMMRLAFEVVGRTLLGADIADEIAAVEAVLPEASDWVFGHLRAPIKLPPTFPTPKNLRFRRIVRVLDEVVQRVIDKHRRSEGRPDMLSLLMDARHDDSGETMSDKQLRDEVLTFLLAGHETTGTALASIFYLLSEHGAIEARYLAEVDAVLGRTRTPTPADLPRLPYTGQIIDEAMRLYPPAWSFTRTAIDDDVLGPYHVPRGAMVVVSPWVNHRHPAFWTDPEVFDPERFAPERAKRHDPYHYFPFGGGPHMCIGKYLTLFEVKIALAMIGQRFRIVRAGDGPMHFSPRISLRPSSVPVRIERRASLPTSP